MIQHEGMDDGAFVLDDELATVFGENVFGLAAARLDRHLYWFSPQHILLQAARTNALISHASVLSSHPHLFAVSLYNCKCVQVHVQYVCVCVHMFKHINSSGVQPFSQFQEHETC